MLVANERLIDRMIAVENANLRSRIAGFAGVRVEQFGQAEAFVAPGFHARFFNSVLGTSHATLEHLDDIEALYRHAGLRPTFEVVPSRHSEALGVALSRRGYAMVEFHAGLACKPEPVKEPALRVDEVRFDAEFAALYRACWQASDPELANVGMEHWVNNSEWRFFIARVDGAAAGAAILDVRNETAMLGSAGTLPAHRGRGVQQALIARRINEAARMGCDLLVGGAYFGTSSMRNQQRAGLHTVFTRGIWVHYEPSS